MIRAFSSLSSILLRTVWRASAKDVDRTTRANPIRISEPAPYFKEELGERPVARYSLCFKSKASEQASFSDVILFTRFFSYFLFAKRLLLFFSHREPLAGNAPGGNTP